MRVVIIGAGIVGAATAFQISRRWPSARLTVVEKELSPGLHQTGRNSGVIHSGIYYRPGSAKALNCRRGKRLLEQFCDQHQLDYQLCGKVIVATRPDELDRLESLLERGKRNGVDCRLIDPQELRRLEPAAAGLRAIQVPETGIIDYQAVLLRLLEESEAELLTSSPVLSLEKDRVVTVGAELKADVVVNCAGLQCDRVARLSGYRPALRIVPFKGEYYCLRPEAHHLCTSLIYPVPDPAFPFLGVHLTRLIGGGVECGPNAVLALGREAYQKLDLNLADLLDSLTYPGFLKLAARHWRMGLGEIHRSFSKQAFVKALQRLCPDLREHHLDPAPCGIRAQAVLADGRLEDDFHVARHGRVINVLNAPSPAATASLAIGESIAELIN